MHRKILGICAALVAIGALMAIPALAAASPVVTENGVKVETGKKIVAIGEEKSEFNAGSGILKVACDDFWLTGTLVANTGTTIQGTIERASFNNKNATTGETEPCSGTLGATTVSIPGLVAGTSHWCLHAAEKPADQFSLVGANCGTATGTVTFVLVAGGTTCR